MFVLLKKMIKWSILAVIIIVLVFHFLVFGLLSIWKTEPVTNSMFMLAHRLHGGDVTQQWVDYDNIVKFAKQAAVASEDAKFVSHHGFDTQAIEQALEKNQELGKISVGGSTITQQLAKNLFLTAHRSYIRKAEEAVITIMIEKIWDKQRILETYLNVVEFGNGIYGIESAAGFYFNKHASQLSKEESALLICMLTNPKYYQENLNNTRLRNKQRIILGRMNSAQLPKS